MPHYRQGRYRPFQDPETGLWHVGSWHAGGRLISIDWTYPTEDEARARIPILEADDRRRDAEAARAR